MMPFVILMLLILIPMLRSSEKITPLPLLALSGLIIVLAYIDWFVAFLCLSAAGYCLYRFFRDKDKRDNRFGVLALVLGVALLTGIALIFWEFASYSGTHRVALYWKYRFLSRGFSNPDDSYRHLLPNIAFHFATSYLPLLVPLIWSFTGHKLQLRRIRPSGLSRHELLFIGLYTCSLGIYLLILSDWASGHEFSVIPAGLLLAYLGARWLPLRSTATWPVITVFIMVSLGQYYFINRPGSISRDGMPYNTFETFGKQLRQIPPGDKIFSDLKEICPMIEYYAGRNLTLVPDSTTAKQLMRDWGLKRSIWAATSDFTLRGIDMLRAQ
jgi:uncharacterized membrane protein